MLLALSFAGDGPDTLSSSRDMLPEPQLLQELRVDLSAEGKSGLGEEVPEAPAKLLPAGGHSAGIREEETC